MQLLKMKIVKLSMKKGEEIKNLMLKNSNHLLLKYQQIDIKMETARKKGGVSMIRQIFLVIHISQQNIDLSIIMIQILIMQSMLILSWMKIYIRKVQLIYFHKDHVPYNGCLVRGVKKFPKKTKCQKCQFNLIRLLQFKLFINWINLELILIINNSVLLNQLVCLQLCSLLIRYLHPKIRL